MVALVLPNYLFPTTSSYPFGVPQTPAEGPPTPASHSPSPSLPPLPPSPPRRPDSPLFNSRCSSPLQLNLLQLEEPPRAEGGTVGGGPGSSAGPPPPSEEAAEPEARLVSSDPLCPATSPQTSALAPLPPGATSALVGWCISFLEMTWGAGQEILAEFLNEAEMGCLPHEGTVLSL